MLDVLALEPVTKVEDKRLWYPYETIITAADSLK
jgi:hypothetical protein